jgi:hypothetical protein
MKTVSRIMMILIKISQLVALLALIRCFGPQGAEHIRASLLALTGRLKASFHFPVELFRSICTYSRKPKGEIL